MRVLELIKQRYEYGYPYLFDKLIIDVMHNPQEIIPVVLLENELIGDNGEFDVASEQLQRDIKSTSELSEYDNAINTLICEYSILGMFDLGCAIPQFGKRLVLYFFTKKKSDSFFVGEYWTPKVVSSEYVYEEMNWDNMYKEDYYSYISEIDKWSSRLAGLTDGIGFCFNEVKYKDCISIEYSPRAYSKVSMTARGLVNWNELVSVTEYMDVITEQEHISITGPVIKKKNTLFALEYSELDIEDTGVVQVHQNDIVYWDANHIVFIDVEPETAIYADAGARVIRAKGVSPHFLYLYLKSDISQMIMYEKASISTRKKIIKDDLQMMYFEPPKRDDIVYEMAYKSQSFVVDSIEKYYSILELMSVEDAKSLEDAFIIECTSDTLFCKWAIVRDYVIEHINEINKCMVYKLHLSTLSLAGSILETILLDWVSDIDRKNYFNNKQPFKILKQRWDVDQGKYKDDEFYYKAGDLTEYINYIKQVKDPDWDEFAEKAHHIREVRNIVHVRNYVKGTEIDEESCKSVIQDLKDILKSRGIRTN